MSHLAAALTLSLALFAAAEVHAQVTEAQCARDYDACKKKHIFDKKPCRQRRDNCQLQVLRLNESVQHQSNKNRMMGVADSAPGQVVPDQIPNEHLTPAQRKAQAAARLRARQEAKSEQPAGPSGMRDSVQRN